MEIHDDPYITVKFEIEFEYPVHVGEDGAIMRARNSLIGDIKDGKLPDPHVTRMPPTYTIYCSACNTRMVIMLFGEGCTDNSEIKCPMVGCRKSTGYHGWMCVAGGQEKYDPGRKMK